MIVTGYGKKRILTVSAGGVSFCGVILVALLAPTGALVVMMVYYIYIYPATFFRFSLSPLMQLMLQVSL